MTMTKQEHETLIRQIHVLEDLMSAYSGKTIDNVLHQLRARWECAHDL